LVSFNITIRIVVTFFNVKISTITHTNLGEKLYYKITDILSPDISLTTKIVSLIQKWYYFPSIHKLHNFLW
jgi:hypothetical protein